MIEILNYLNERVGLISLLAGMVFTITALIMYRFTPKKINIFYGYRSASSMSDQAIWDFSQKYAAVKMLQIGLFMIAVSFLNVFIAINQELATVLGIALMIVACIYMIVKTEIAIKKNFPNKQ